MNNLRNRKIFFFALVGILILGVLLFPLGIINTMTSIKYETENSTSCISLVTGKDLCTIIQTLKTLWFICGISLCLLIVFRKRILKQNTKIR